MVAVSDARGAPAGAGSRKNATERRRFEGRHPCAAGGFCVAPVLVNPGELGSACGQIVRHRAPQEIRCILRPVLLGSGIGEDITLS
jgi:hypothetical protein